MLVTRPDTSLRISTSSLGTIVPVVRIFSSNDSERTTIIPTGVGPALGLPPPADEPPPPAPLPVAPVPVSDAVVTGLFGTLPDWPSVGFQRVFSLG